MTKSRFFFFLASTLLVLPILAGSLLGAAVDDEAAPGGDSLDKFLSVFTEALSLVDQTYVEETDQEALMAAALDGVTDALDPLAVYVPKAAVPGYLEARSVGTARSGLFLVRERGMVYVLAVRPGGPAERAGVREGDLIAEIDGRSTRVLPMWEVHQLLAGAPGTVIDLELVRYAESSQAQVTLGDFEEPAPTLTTDRGVPVMTLRSIGESTPDEVRALLGRMGDAELLLIDLRGVAGGEMDAAYEIAGLLLEGAAGELGRLQHRGDTLESFEGGDGPWSGRIVVLTDRATLGPAEVLATILRQSAGAELVGTRTFGYAGRQSMLQLGSGGVLFLADAFYTGPDFEALDEPLEPDVRVADRRGFEPADEEGVDGEEDDTDPVLDKGIERLLTPPGAEGAEPAEEEAAA
jgi:carboxyl-terminal processing protease